MEGKKLFLWKFLKSILISRIYRGIFQFHEIFYHSLWSTKVQKKMQNHKPGILSKNGHQIFSVTFWVIRKKYPHAYVWVKIDKVSLCLERTSVALDSGSGSQKMAFVYREQQSYRSAWLKLCGNSSKMPKTPKLWEHFYESSGNTSWQPAERNSTRTPFLCRWDLLLLLLYVMFFIHLKNQT